MQIDRVGAPIELASTTRTRRRQPGFAVPDDEEAAGTQGPAEASGAAQISPLTLQADEMAHAQIISDQAAARQGDAVLGAIRGLQLAMLGGSVGQGDLAALAASLPEAADPKLNAVLQAIAQRAAIEAARRK